MFNLKSYFNAKQQMVNLYLDNYILNYSSPTRLINAMKYSLMAGGKRIRPILCIAACEAFGGKEENVLTISCALEMIHTYSLIHDDLPAMDNDDLRRGKPTCHKKFDEATAILAGDALLTYAFQILAVNDLSTKENAHQHINIIFQIAKLAGYHGMIEGQMQDITAENKELTLEELETMHSLKTGALIEASVITGATLGGASIEQIDLLKKYAKNIGLAFQVADDILNAEGDPKLLGKAVGTDAIRNKNTFPALMGIEKSKEFANELIAKAHEAISSFDDKSEPLRAIADYIIERNH